MFEELSRVYSDRYDIAVDEAGRIILDPKLTAEASRLRLGGRPLTDDEFQKPVSSQTLGTSGICRLDLSDHYGPDPPRVSTDSCIWRLRLGRPLLIGPVRAS